MPVTVKHGKSQKPMTLHVHQGKNGTPLHFFKPGAPDVKRVVAAIPAGHSVQHSVSGMPVLKKIKK
jgi:hypothetical protein